ncbi:hypothetical protein COP2_033473 [Malus domestica]
MPVWRRRKASWRCYGHMPVVLVKLLIFLKARSSLARRPRAGLGGRLDKPWESNVRPGLVGILGCKLILATLKEWYLKRCGTGLNLNWRAGLSNFYLKQERKS